MFEDIQEGIKEGDFSIAAIADFFEATSDLLKRECRDCNFHNQTSKISLVASVASSWARKVRLQTNKDYITLPDYIETDVMNTSLDATADIIKKLQDIPTNVSAYVDEASYSKFFPCSDGWTYFKHTKKCYKYRNTKTSWANASTLCQSESQNPTASLVSVHDNTTNHFLTTLTKKNSWIGGYQDDTQTWFWSDGSDWNEFGNWHYNEPDEEGNEKYLWIDHWQDTAYWSDAENEPDDGPECPEGFLCQYDPNPCHQGWTYFMHTNLCYNLVQVQSNFNEALEACHDSISNPSTNLVSIHDKITNDFIAKLTDRETSWIGASRNSDGDWAWSDGSVWGFNNIDNENDGLEDYMVINWPGLSSGKWMSVFTDSHLAPALCQYDPRQTADTPQPTTLPASTCSPITTSECSCTTTTTTTTTTITTTTTSTPEACEPEWTYFEHTEMCYRYYWTMKNWIDSLAFCKSETTNPSANLVSIPDKTTNDFLLNSMTNTEFNTEVWTGGFKENGHWVWSDGSQWTGWTNWASGNPSGGNENHLEFYGQRGNGKWNDGNYEYQRWILCQYNPLITTTSETTAPISTSSISTSTSTNIKSCDAEWTYFHHTAKCYKYYSTMKNWMDSLSFCKSETTHPSANLASIPDKTTNDFLLNSITNTIYNTEVWTGGFKENGHWVWSDGSQWTGWTNWASGNPSGGNENHLEFYGQRGNGKWNDGNYEYQRRILCQYDPSD